MSLGDSVGVHTKTQGILYKRQRKTWAKKWEPKAFEKHPAQSSAWFIPIQFELRSPFPHRPQHYQFMGATESWQNRVSDATVKLIPGTMASPVWYFCSTGLLKKKSASFSTTMAINTTVESSQSVFFPIHLSLVKKSAKVTHPPFPKSLMKPPRIYYESEAFFFAWSSEVHFLLGIKPW